MRNPAIIQQAIEALDNEYTKRIADDSDERPDCLAVIKALRWALGEDDDGSDYCWVSVFLGQSAIDLACEHAVAEGDFDLQ